jgi:DNA-binding transcriptional MerR regulator
MFKIGDFSRMTQVTVKALRHYDELGLLRPAEVDPFTGYRYYAASQLARLNRILALKDLGLSLEQIGPFLDAELFADQLRALLLVKQGEVQVQIEAQQVRLQRIEARLRQLEQQTPLTQYDVVVKRVEAQQVASIFAVLPSHDAIGGLFRELNLYRQKLHLNATAWTAIWHDPEHRETDIQAEATFTSPEAPPPDGRVQPRELPTVETMACTVHQGSADTIGSACMALLTWLETNGYDLAGPERVLSLHRGEDGEEAVSELQVPVRKAEAFAGC